MRTHTGSKPHYLSAVCLMSWSLAAAVTALPGTASVAWAQAADDCVARPNAPAPAGQHWWYRTDRSSKRKCWFLGPKDKAAAARKADRPERAAPMPDAEPVSAPDAPPVSAESGDMAEAQAAPAAQESVPYLVDWSGLLEEAGIVNAKDNVLTGLAGDPAARTALAMQEPSAQEAESETGKTGAGTAQTAVAPADNAGGVAAMPAGLPVSYIAALLIGGSLGPAIFSIVRARRRRKFRRDANARTVGADADALPAFLHQPEAGLVPSAQYGQVCDRDYDHTYEQGHDHAYEQDQPQDQEYGRAYGGEEELRRILAGVQRRVA